MKWPKAYCKASKCVKISFLEKKKKKNYYGKSRYDSLLAYINVNESDRASTKSSIGKESFSHISVGI